MSASPYGVRPPATDNRDPASAMGMASRVVRLDPGLFALSLVPGPSDDAAGLPAVRVCAPPGPAGRRENVGISTTRGDGWLTMRDEPILLRAPASGGSVLVTQYWADGASGAPPLKLERLDAVAPAGMGGPSPGMTPLAGATLSGGQGPAPASLRSPIPGAEVVAHVEGLGDVEGRLGEWVGGLGSGRAIEGFSLTPARDLAPGDFEVRAVLGRDWLSPWLPGGSFCGSRGLALPLRGFCLRLHPQAAARVDLAIFARFVDGTEVGPMGSDRICAAPSLAALEAVRVTVRPRIG